jgi:hypothetical protein
MIGMDRLSVSVRRALCNIGQPSTLLIIQFALEPIWLVHVLQSKPRVKDKSLIEWLLKKSERQ